VSSLQLHLNCVPNFYSLLVLLVTLSNLPHTSTHFPNPFPFPILYQSLTFSSSHCFLHPSLGFTCFQFIYCALNLLQHLSPYLQSLDHLLITFKLQSLMSINDKISLKYRIKYVFDLLSFSKIWNWSLFKIFDHFSHSSLEMYEFSPFS